MSETLIAEQDVKWEDLGGGIKRKVMAQDETMMLVKVAFEKGGIGAAHHHHHTQASTIESGVFEIKIGDESQVLKAGDVYFVPSNVIHSALCLEEGVLVDVFTPRRDDFLP